LDAKKKEKGYHPSPTARLRGVKRRTPLRDAAFFFTTIRSIYVLGARYSFSSSKAVLNVF
jgi:hypothetical protein